jgi:hypothetical protein
VLLGSPCHTILETTDAHIIMDRVVFLCGFSLESLGVFCSTSQVSVASLSFIFLLIFSFNVFCEISIYFRKSLEN